jgi:23S rRNA pseudouridine1911/1915/1917 synthase
MLEFISETTNRLDKFIASKVEVSRSKVQKAIKDGKVMVDGIIVLHPDYDVIVGNKVTLPEFEPEALKPSDMVLKVVFENADLAVIDKPAGLVVHPGAGNLDETLANALLTYFPGIEKVGEPHRPGIVHRLDEDTSGLILIAKTGEAYEYFKNLFQERKIEKEYLALVHLVPSKKHDTINAALEKVPLKQKMKVGTGKEAITEYWVVKEGFIDGLDEVALLRVKLHTGRTHQIRAHLAHIGHPILGDEVYGSNYKQQDVRVINRQFLHAYRLKFQLLDGTWIELNSQLPKELEQVLKKASINYEYDYKF